MARGVRFLLGFRQYPFLKKNGPGIPVFGYCPFFLRVLHVYELRTKTGKKNPNFVESDYAALRNAALASISVSCVTPLAALVAVSCQSTSNTKGNIQYLGVVGVVGSL